MSDSYKEGYYEGWIAALHTMDEISTHYAQQYEREGTYLIEDGSLHGDSVHLAYGKAQEDCERYAYDQLQDWMNGRIPGDKPPTFPENVVDAEVHKTKSEKIKMEAKTRDQFPAQQLRGQHTCGRQLVIQVWPELYDVTSLSNVPEQLKGVSFDRLPEEYHQYIQVNTLIWYEDQHRHVSYCPQCGLELSEETVTSS